MSQSVTLQVSKIRIQKDEYLTSAGAIGETEFWKSNELQAEVLQFKRATATCRIEGSFSPVEVELIVSLRAGFVRVRIMNKDQGHAAKPVAQLLQLIVAQLHHKPGYDPKGALVPIFSRDSSRYMLCKTYDSHWLIAALHEVKDEKGINFSIQDDDFNRLITSSAAPPISAS